MTEKQSTDEDFRYYAILFVADLVAGLETPRISAVPQKDKESAVHFAVYNGDELNKLVFLNLQPYERNSTAPRDCQTFDVGSVLGDNVQVRRLTGADSAATSGVTWAGQSTDDAGRVVGDLLVEKVYRGL